MIDLDTLPGGSTSSAYGISNNGQVVGYSNTASGEQHAFLYSGGTMTDLNNLVGLPSGVYLFEARAISDFGQIAANGSNAHAYLLTPEYSPLLVLNPFVPYARLLQPPPTLDVPTVLSSLPATSLAADGESAVVLAYQSKSSEPVTFAVQASATGLSPGTAVATLGPFLPSYLASPSPLTGNSQSYPVTTATSGPDAAGTYTFLALLWAPNAMPVPNVPLSLAVTVPLVPLTVTATQQGQTAQGSIALKPPPLLLVHGVWSSAIAAGFTPRAGGFYDYISGLYPHNLVYPVNYGGPPGSATDFSSLSFSDPNIQLILLSSIADALGGAAASGMAARTVDVVAHSMGGLVTRYFMSSLSSLPDFLPNPVHNLITIGTPHLGTLLATRLDLSQGLPIAIPNPEVQQWCAAVPLCTLGGLMAKFGMPVGAGTESMEPGSTQIKGLSASNEFRAIIGDATVLPESLSEQILDDLIGAFLPGKTVANILNEPNDMVVPISSQDPLSGVTDAATIMGVVHTNLCADIPVISWICSDTGETQSQTVWGQAYYWLTGGTGTAPAARPTSNAARRPLTSAGTVPPPVLNLSGYTQVPASNVAVLPATGSTLTINSATNITATSSTKTITEVLLLQTVTDPTDTPLLYATQSPFTIAFTPTRMGVTSFGAIAVFSDNTYATTTLNYTFQTDGTQYALNLVNVPVAVMTVGDSRVINAVALLASGPVDVTQVATYTASSGSTNVFSVASGGVITANGNGVDVLNVSYGGVTATAQIAVGACTYALNPTNQIVPNTGGPVAIQVATQPGCAWTAAGGAAWLPLTSASGSGNGSITLTAGANNTGGTQGAMVTLAGLQAFVTQPATACTYVLSQTLINATAAGTSGTIGVTTSCPVIASSDATWVSATPLGSSVSYTVAVNNGTPQRTATLTIGTQPVSVVQVGNAIGPSYTISGQTTLYGTGLPGVTMTLSGSQTGTTTTDSSGNYGFNLPAGGNYTVTPSLNGYTFSPPSSTFNNLSSNETADFAGTAAVSAPILVLQDQQSNAVSVWLMGGPNGTVIEQSPIIATASPNWSVVGTADFNNDGVPDILLQNQATNQISVWYMGGTNGLTIVSSPIVGQPSPGWEVAGLGDFNRDGYVDLLLQNSPTNALSIWYLGPNFTVLYTSAVATPLANWHVVGVADFNGDGSPDLLLQNQVTNQVSISYMSGPDGTTVLSSPIIAAALAGWKVVGTSDFSNEAVPDIVLQNQSTNQVSVWYMGGPQGATITSSPIIAMADPGWSILGSNNTQPPPTRQPRLFLQNQQSNAVSKWEMGGTSGTVIEESPIIATAAANWRVVASADFNNDGVPDILLQDQVSNQISVWYMGGTDGLTITTSPIVGQPATDWEVVGTADFNHDGTADLLLQNTSTNALSIWYLGPNFTVLSAPVVATPAANWHVVGVADFNGDGSPDLLLQNLVTNEVSIWYLTGSQGTTILSAPIIATSDADWKVVGASDFNDDGVPDIVLQNQVTNQVSVWYMGPAQGNPPQGQTYTSAPIIQTAAPGWSVVAVR